MNDHWVVGVDTEYANLEQIAIASGTNPHREVVIESPLGDCVTDGVGHVLVSDAVLLGCLRDTH
jgi:hypothetical protein